MRDIPVTYVIFDLLYLDGRSTMPLPYEERRELLEELELEGPAWRTPAYHRGEGSALLEATRAAGHRGRDRQAARLPLRAGPARVALDQGQERAAARTS